ncbi:MobA/MobL protein [Salmonella enterica subsp. enterica serovar Hvittingfoss str. A4-620]|nr:MobA/MobL protein [Salmonella enterica subsp. enterica serovar Hvittingfoss str. A4-620]
MVDVRSFTITVLPEPEEIVLPDFSTTTKQQPVSATPSISRRPAVKSYRNPNKVSKVNISGKKSPVLIVPEPTASTKLKPPSLQNTRAMNRAPMSKRKQVKPRQNGMFKRFTLLVVEYIRERFVWARRKSDTIDADHDKRIAENYVFDEVLGRHVSRVEYEKRAVFNSNGNKPIGNEMKRFPSRPTYEQSDISDDVNPTLLIVSKNSNDLSSTPLKQKK